MIELCSAEKRNRCLLNQPQCLWEIYRPGIETKDSSEVSVSPAAEAIYKSVLLILRWWSKQLWSSMRLKNCHSSVGWNPGAGKDSGFWLSPEWQIKVGNQDLEAPTKEKVTIC